MRGASATPNWHKSTRSATNGACVEVATNQPRVGVRDTKLTDSPELWFHPGSWTAFTDAIKQNQIGMKKP